VTPSLFVREKSGSFRDAYKLGSVLGSGLFLSEYFNKIIGAFGEVRKCVHRKSGLIRAVKILRKTFLQNEEEKERFMSEIEILRQIVS
jgi:serine/threonine protein kinase